MIVLETLGTIAMVLAVIGVLLNNRKNRNCFYVWFISNSILIYVHLNVNLYSLVIRNIVFLLLAVEGWYKWRK